jgi:hypothetical protein
MWQRKIKWVTRDDATASETDAALTSTVEENPDPNTLYLKPQQIRVLEVSITAGEETNQLI